MSKLSFEKLKYNDLPVSSFGYNTNIFPYKYESPIDLDLEKDRKLLGDFIERSSKFVNENDQSGDEPFAAISFFLMPTGSGEKKKRTFDLLVVYTNGSNNPLVAKRMNRAFHERGRFRKLSLLSFKKTEEFLSNLKKKKHIYSVLKKNGESENLLNKQEPIREISPLDYLETQLQKEEFELESEEVLEFIIERIPSKHKMIIAKIDEVISKRDKTPFLERLLNGVSEMLGLASNVVMPSAVKLTFIILCAICAGVSFAISENNLYDDKDTKIVEKNIEDFAKKISERELEEIKKKLESYQKYGYCFSEYLYTDGKKQPFDLQLLPNLNGSKYPEISSSFEKGCLLDGLINCRYSDEDIESGNHFAYCLQKGNSDSE